MTLAGTRPPTVDEWEKITGDIINFNTYKSINEIIIERCIIYVSEAHGKSIEELYDDADFRKVDRILR